MQTEHVCRHFNSWAVPCSKSFYVITLSRCAAQGLVNGLLTAGKTLLSTSVLLLVSLFIFSCIAVELIAKDIDVTHRDGTESRCVWFWWFTEMVKSLCGKARALNFTHCRHCRTSILPVLQQQQQLFGSHLANLVCSDFFRLCSAVHIFLRFWQILTLRVLFSLLYTCLFWKQWSASIKASILNMWSPELPAFYLAYFPVFYTFSHNTIYIYIHTYIICIWHI